ncbi:MAG: SEC-C metal-binding domain-containing protein [Mariprofundus sp.]|nr:SEC-C metal-binding domain-containing protein [Mariprofundus sp.]
MALKVQRNDPCPCGSGKKYKKCCMIVERDQMTASINRREGVQQALAWISQSYSDQINGWVEDVWLVGISEQQRQGIGRADPKIRSIHDVNLLEQLVADGHFSSLDDSPLQLILATNELVLNQEQRDYLQQLASRSLNLYTVSACVAGESFTVRELLNDSAAPMNIADGYGSRMFDVGDRVGLRLLETPAGWETSGAIYHIPEEYLAEVRELLEQAEASERAMLLIHYWLKLVAAHV